MPLSPHLRRRLLMAAGPLLFLGFFFFVDPVPGEPAVGRTLALAVTMAWYWLTEALPMSVTALLPVVLLPLLGVMPAGDVASEYMNDLIFLFLGGFMLAVAMQDWGLHRRLALRILLWIGRSPSMLLFGVMLATWVISAWVNNTATTLMMLPIVLSLATQLEERAGEDARRLTTTMLLAVAYAASIGGMATLIGTAPNLVFLRVYGLSFPEAPPLTFLTWMAVAAPISALMLVLSFLYFRATSLRGCRVPVDREMIRREYEALGRPSYEERTMFLVFTLFVVLLITRADVVVGDVTVRGWASRVGLGGRLGDGGVAIAVACLLFVIPARARRGFMLEADAIGRLPWDIVLLFGGGFALAEAFQVSGLSGFMGSQLAGLSGAPPIVTLLVVVTVVCFLSELASNTALSQVILPVIASMAVAMGTHPLFLMVPATMAASCGFMLPVATPPNTIVYGTRRVRTSEMVRVGFAIDWIGIVLVTILMYTWGSLVMGIDPGTPPAWLVR
jgi:sodium-dependent dicarboxylate transporter 2/3/5